MITANIYNANGEPLAEGFLIHSDNEFDAVEIAAQEAAESGQRCCIKWSRDSDGQAGFWGPAGACFEAHWYAKPGRPQEMAEGGRHNIYIGNADWSRAQEIGGGNASKGIQIALTAFPTPTTPDWIELDVALRGTGIDAQDFADRTGLLVIEDADAATAGAACWYGARVSKAAGVSDYEAAGGTVTAVYLPRD